MRAVQGNRLRRPPGLAGTVPERMAGPPASDDAGGGKLSVKPLVIPLVGQLTLFGGLIALRVHGFPFLGGPGDGGSDAPAAKTVPAGTVPRANINRFDA